MQPIKKLAPNKAMIMWAKQIREYAEQHDWFTAQDIQRLTKYSSTATRQQLNYLVENGCLISKTEKWKKFYKING